ncbi:MAG: ATP-dependent zinc metalloprotease FtsH [Oscillospiraceae bacterium]
MNEKKNLRLLYLLLPLLVILAASWFLALQGRAGMEVTDREMRQLFEDEQVKSFTIDGSTVQMQLYAPYESGDGRKWEKVYHELYDFQLFYDSYHELVEEQAAAGVIQDYNYSGGASEGWLARFLPYLLMGVLFFLLVNLMMNRMAGGNNNGMAKFGTARTKTREDYQSKVTFADVAGADEEKEELYEIVDFLRDPGKYTALGARIPRGVLLVGPPGTGKTLLAKAVAGEAGVGFLSISGSDFVEMYVGVGASRVRDLFDQAKKIAPAIVFIDEIDAVGRQRGTGLGGGHDEREQTLNQLLVEMDGFGSNQGVVVLAATNRADILDPALLRPGRFDRQVYVGLPDIKGREEILQVHTKKKPLAEDVDLRTVARSTAGFTGADLENLANEAALLAARRSDKFITAQDLKEAVVKVIAGPEKKSRVIPEHERRLTAYHEAGHAVVIRALPRQDPVHQITIIPRGQAGGMTIHLPREDRSYRSRADMAEEIAVCLGGRAAEQLVLGDISTGAGSDLQRASSLARDMVMRYGMSERLGNVVYDSGQNEVFIGRSMAQTKSYSEEVAGQIDEEVKRLVDEAYERAQEILRGHSAALEAVARYLLEHETMESEEFERVCREAEAGERE